jgi:Ca2+-binding RTX toxin-like protein
MPDLQGRAVLILMAALLSAAPAAASTVSNGSNVNGELSVTPTGADEANALTVTYVPASGAALGGYTVHDNTTAVTIAGTCTSCTQTDANTVFVPAGSGATITTGNADSSVALLGQEALGGGANLISGGAGSDTLSGGFVGDTINGGGGVDTIAGGRGSDNLNGGSGNDTATGGSGSDVFQTTDGDGADAYDGGGDVDGISYSDKTAAVSVTNDGVANDGVAGEGDNVRGMEILTGTAFADTLSVSSSRNGGQLYGLGGNDTLTAAAGAQLLDGAAGNDVLDAGGGADDLFGGPGDDTLSGGAGDDEIEADAGNDTASGGQGADRFDSLFDGDGADAWSGGAGDDSITYAGAGGPVTITADGAADDGAPAEGDNVGADIEVIFGTIDDDAITGGAVDNTIVGGGGADVLSGGDGNDTLLSNSPDGAPMTLRGGNGADTLTGQSGDDALDGGAGDDLLNGGPGGADVLSGGPGVDAVSFAFVDGGVAMSPNGVADDGRPGEGANIGADVENLTGTIGPDTITGAAGVSNWIDGLGGGDAISVASTPADHDTVFCRAAVGFLGRAVPNGSSANDVIDADVLDSVSRSGTTACATIHQPRATAPKLAVLETKIVAAGGVFTVPLTCAAAAPRCRVTAQVSSARGTILDVARGTIAVGKRAQLLFRLSRLRRAWLTEGRTLHLRLTVEVSDATGKSRTVNRKLAVRGRG